MGVAQDPLYEKVLATAEKLVDKSTIRRYRDRMMEAGKAHEFINSKKVALITTVDQRGYPHTTPVWFVEHLGKLYFSSSPDSAKVRHLRRRDNVSMAIVGDMEDRSGREVFILKGKAKVFPLGEVAEGVYRQFEAKYNWRPKEGAVVVEVTPVWIITADYTKGR